VDAGSGKENRLNGFSPGVHFYTPLKQGVNEKFSTEQFQVRVKIVQ